MGFLRRHISLDVRLSHRGVCPRNTAVDIREVTIDVGEVLRSDARLGEVSREVAGHRDDQCHEKGRERAADTETEHRVLVVPEVDFASKLCYTFVTGHEPVRILRCDRRSDPEVDVAVCDVGRVPSSSASALTEFIVSPCNI